MNLGVKARAVLAFRSFEIPKENTHNDQSVSIFASGAKRRCPRLPRSADTEDPPTARQTTPPEPSDPDADGLIGDDDAALRSHSSLIVQRMQRQIACWMMTFGNRKPWYGDVFMARRYRPASHPASRT
jgi:hypothetical protein